MVNIMEETKYIIRDWSSAIDLRNTLHPTWRISVDVYRNCETQEINGYSIEVYDKSHSECNCNLVYKFDVDVTIDGHYSFSTEEDNILSKTIAPGAKETGYVYFMDVAGPNPEGGSDNTSYISDKTIADAVFLKVSMLGKTSKKDGKITGNYIDSYIQLK